MIYQNKAILLASKHHKEEAIEPVFRKNLGSSLVVADIDTDQFGTFIGEIPRFLSAYETCISKAKYAAQEKRCDLSIASEGSFGPHPSNPFIPHAQEIMAFVDLENNWVIAEQLLTSNTNYRMMTINETSPLDFFLESVFFPSHALTLQSGDCSQVIAKGIQDQDTLQDALLAGFKKHKELFIATDMRAMMNPTRMETLSELAEKLVLRIKTLCPGCGIPGFGFQSVSGHLPCSLCKHNTKLYQFEEWRCIQCNYKQRQSRKDRKIESDPTYCDYCNP